MGLIKINKNRNRNRNRGVMKKHITLFIVSAILTAGVESYLNYSSNVINMKTFLEWKIKEKNQ